MVGPNVSVILRQYGLLTEKYGGTEVNGVSELAVVSVFPNQELKLTP